MSSLRLPFRNEKCVYCDASSWVVLTVLDVVASCRLNTDNFGIISLTHSLAISIYLSIYVSIYLSIYTYHFICPSPYFSISFALKRSNKKKTLLINIQNCMRQSCRYCKIMFIIIFKTLVYVFLFFFFFFLFFF